MSNRTRTFEIAVNYSGTDFKGKGERLGAIVAPQRVFVSLYRNDMNIERQLKSIIRIVRLFG